MSIFDFFRRFTQPHLTLSFQVEEAESPISDKQRQFLLDLGEKVIPSCKDKASERLDQILAPYESAMKVCFKWWGNMERPSQRTLQIAWRKAGFTERFPIDGTQCADEQRLEFISFVRDTVGQQIMQEMGPIGVKEVEGRLVLKPKRESSPRKAVQRKPREIKFECSHCGQHFAAPEQLANTKITCQGCQQEITIPRPKIGYYAAPSPSQLEDAELYKVAVTEGMHRGELSEELQKAMSDVARKPSAEEYETRERRRTERYIREADEEIQEIRTKLKAPVLSEQEVADLQQALKKAKAAKKRIIDSEKEAKREEERFKREEIREEKEFRRMCYEREFNRGEDWSEFYRKPTRQQFDAIYDRLDTNKPGWSGFVEVVEAIDVLFPELRKSR